MEINKQLAVITPILTLTKPEEEALFQTSIKSVFDQKGGLPAYHVVVSPEQVTLSQIKEKPTGYDTIFKQVEREKGADTNFQAQVNAAVAALPKEVTHFVVLEFDDALRPTYTKHAKTYLEAFPDASVLLPLVEEINIKGELQKYSNEVLWTPNFADNLGELDYDALTGFANFHLTGAVINKADFLEAGGLKESMELTFNYEFLLRLTQKNKVVRSIPKVVYTHLDNRPGSLFNEYTNGRTALTDEEVRFWFDTAHKECFFPEDRKVAYSPV